jgi:DNA end-binding protein Ku
MRTKEYLAAIRPRGDGLVLSTMHFADELVPSSSLEGMPGEVALTDRERQIAIQLVESLAAPFEHEKFEDTYREQVLGLIDAKAKGETIELEPVETPKPADDLLAALEASLAAAKDRATQRGDGKAATSKKPATSSKRSAASGTKRKAAASSPSRRG